MIDKALSVLRAPYKRRLEKRIDAFLAHKRLPPDDMRHGGSLRRDVCRTLDVELRDLNRVIIHATPDTLPDVIREVSAAAQHIGQFREQSLDAAWLSDFLSDLEIMCTGVLTWRRYRDRQKPTPGQLRGN